jgi:threonylcarbamoyladenosine tRNA methylthiotransferase MtaB
MTGPANGPEVVTLGCRLNALESEVIRTRAAEAGLTDAVIVNTCAVTAEAERQARQTIRKLRRERPAAEIIVTGCAAQISPERFAAMPEVSRVIGNEEKLAAESYTGSNRVSVGDIMSARAAPTHMIGSLAERTRAFVQVQQGCDHRCTFCIIPFGRGNSRSVAPDALVRQARRLVDGGFSEIVLTGVDISSYGRDTGAGMSLGDLCARLLAEVPGLPRLRLSSLDPAVVDEALIALLAREPRLMPHLHLSVQAGSDLILKRMKRRHLRADVIALAERVKRARPDLVLGADLIAGFPTETDTLFDGTMRIVEEAELTYLHVFPFSARAGTPAALMPQLPGTVRRDRAAALRALGDARRSRYFTSLAGSHAEILAERDGRGYTQHYAPTRLVDEAAPGNLVHARITGVGDDGILIAAAA